MKTGEFVSCSGLQFFMIQQNRSVYTGVVTTTNVLVNHVAFATKH